jgi:hypothetical protein
VVVINRFAKSSDECLSHHQLLIVTLVLQRTSGMTSLYNSTTFCTNAKLPEMLALKSHEGFGEAHEGDISHTIKEA